MSTQPAETPAPTVTPEDFQTVHFYPSDPRYRRSGAAVPQLGDIAFCGWVKDTPQRPGGYPAGSENCLMCIRLDGLQERGR